MSLIREDDSPQFAAGILAGIGIVFIASLLYAQIWGQEHRVTLHGKLFKAPDVECGFFLDPLGDSEAIQLLQVLDGNYLCDWLKGTDGREVTITITPDGK